MRLTICVCYMRTMPDSLSSSRACLKNHSYNLHAPICGIFCLHSVDVARYAALIQAKSPTNCNAHLAESIFQTRSSRSKKAPVEVLRASFCFIGQNGAFSTTEQNGIFFSSSFLKPSGNLATDFFCSGVCLVLQIRIDKIGN